MKKLYCKRIVASSLAFIMLCSSIPFSALEVSRTDSLATSNSTASSSEQDNSAFDNWEDSSKGEEASNSSVSDSGSADFSSENSSENATHSDSTSPQNEVISSSSNTQDSYIENEQTPYPSQEEMRTIQERIAQSPFMEELGTGAVEDRSDVTNSIGLPRTNLGSGIQRTNNQIELKNIVIFVRFANQEEYLDSANTTIFNRVYNAPIENFLSLKAYLQKTSYGTLSVETVGFPQQDASFSSVVLAHEENYYKPFNAENNPVGYTNETEKQSRLQEVIDTALAGAKSQIDSSYPNGELDQYGTYTQGTDGHVDALTIVCLPEKTGSVSISHGDLLWPHKADCYSSYTLGGQSIVSYNLLWGSDLLSDSVYSSSTITHEFLHILGMPDLYRYTGSGIPVWRYDVMGNNAPRIPQSMLQYNIRNYMGFAPPLSVVSSDTTGFTLSWAQYIDKNEKNAVILQSPFSADEVFVVEAKDWASLDTNVFYQTSTSSLQRPKGVIVYRVNKAISGNSSGPDDGIYVFRPGDTSAVAATGEYTSAVLAPLDSATGAVRSSLGKPKGQENSGFDNDTLFFSDGSNSGIMINNILYTDSGISFDVTFSNAQGDGTRENPYLIGTPADLSLLNRFPTAYFELSGDLDMTNVPFTPLCTGNSEFTGNLNGNGHTINNLTISSETAALIGYLGVNGTVENLILKKPVIQGEILAGSVAANSQGKIENVHVIGGSIAAAGSSGQAGGIVGYLGDTAEIKNCGSTASVSGEQVGGLVGCVYFGMIANSFAGGKVTALNNTDTHGAIFGVRYAKGGTFDHSGVTDKIFQDVYYDTNATAHTIPGKIDKISDASSAGICGISLPSTISLRKGETGTSQAFYIGIPGAILTYHSSSNDILLVNSDTGDFTALNTDEVKYFIDLSIGDQKYMMVSTVVIESKEQEAKWEVIDGKRYYRLSDGTFAKGKTQIEGEWYYFDEETGVESRGWKTLSDGYWYYFELSTGKMEHSGWFEYKGQKYYANADGHHNKGVATVDGKAYFFSPDFAYRMTGKFTYDGATYYANEDGELNSGWVEDGGDRYYFDPATGLPAKGKTQIEGEWYYFDEETGVESRGWKTLSDGYWYYFELSTGKMEHSGWFEYKGQKYYANADGHHNKGVATVDGKAYFFSPDFAYRMTGKFTYDGATYYANEDGELNSGWVEDGGDRYYFDPATGLPAKGKTQIEGEWYYFDEETGVESRGWKTLSDGYWYYFELSTGKMEHSGWFEYKGQKYYANADGHHNKGVATVDGKAYFFSPDFAYRMTGKFTYDGATYYANEDGELNSGWVEDGGDRYYFDPATFILIKGKAEIEGEWYYFDEETGVESRGWKTLSDGYWYYFELSTGKMEHSGWFEYKGQKYYANADGHHNKGVATVDGKAYFFSPDFAYRMTGKFTYDGATYYANEDGELNSGWVEDGGDRYYFDPATFILIKGKAEIEGEWYYFDEETGVESRGWKTLSDGYWYYFELSTGKMEHSGWFEYKGQKYYANADGHHNKGVATVDGKAYFFSPDFAYRMTGKFTYDGATYYANEDGELNSGWVEDGGDRYYFDPATGLPAKGKTQIEGEWYYFDEETGVESRGWKTLSDGYWYYFELSTGKMEHSGWFEYKGQKYYANADGHHNKGVATVDGKAYFFSPDFAYRMTGKFTYDGATYYANEDGELNSGWVEDGGDRYYFDPATFILIKGKAEIEGEWYYFDEETGVESRGWKTLSDGYWYYFELSTGKMEHSGWFEYKGQKYYANADGHHNKGVATVDGKAYFFSPDTANLLINWFTDSGGNRRYADPVTGVLNTEPGFYTIDNVRCYLLAYGLYVAPPTISGINYEIAGISANVNIHAYASSLTTLNISAYSWDGGVTWTSANTKSFPVGTIITSGTIQVRDAVGNITIYSGDLELKGNGPYMGIDVSSYQGPIDWAAVKASGVDFAIIRGLTWSSSVGYYVMDPYFEYNVRNAKANGIKVGAYLFSYAFSNEEIVTEVNFFHNSKEMQALRRDNIQFDYPVYIDFEWEKILENTTYDQRTEMVRLGMILLEKYGYYPGFYSSHNWAVNYYNAASLVGQGYDFWYARYLTAPNLGAGTKPLVGFESEMWQYSSQGSVNGINGNVDMNICYVDYSTIIGGGGSSGGGADLTLSVYDQNTHAQVTGSVEDILSRIVMNEVGDWQNTEVCKAQAVAAYSWILYQQQHGNAIPSVGLDPATPNSTVRNAVRAVKGQAIYYNGSPANAAYGSASAAYTNTAYNMWGLNLPYLNTSATSPESEFRGRVKEIDSSTMLSNVTKMVGAAKANGTPHSQWVTDPVFDSHGYLTSIKVCGVTVSGSVFYEDCYLLYSPHFTYKYDASADKWIFTTDGFGHCVGMSQYGAYSFAQSGWNYKQILLHYFPGTSVY